MKTAKIICTLGPATASHKRVSELISAGMDVARINMSHGTPEEKLVSMRLVRELSQSSGRSIGVMVDLQGPKLRVGMLPEQGIFLESDSTVMTTVAQNDERLERRGDGPVILPVDYPRLLEDVEPGHRILMDDGRIQLRAVQRLGDALECKVEVGGLLQSKKGINFPDSMLHVPSLTEKDLKDVVVAREGGADFLALSFVRTADDVRSLRQLVASWEEPPAIVAKIERPESLDNLEEIVENSDVVLVARGDLGVEMPVQRVPTIQLDVIQQARRLGREVIIATQMLESMINSPTPTRAEVNDVAVAVMEGADAVMLSGETAVGAYPLEAVRTMAEVVGAVGTVPSVLRPPAPVFFPGMDPHSSATARAATEMARSLKARLIGCFTRTGTTARFISHYRPDVPVLAITDRESTYRRMASMWGVIPCLSKVPKLTDEMFSHVEEQAIRLGLCRHNDLVVLTMGYPPGPSVGTNLLVVRRAGEAITR